MSRPTLVRSQFVGRRLELAALADALHHVGQGYAGTVLISGDAGMGKTRLVEQFSESSAEQGLNVHWGLAHEHAGAPPLWPWVQIFRSFAAAGLLDDGTISESGANREYLLHLVPGSDQPRPSGRTDLFNESSSQFQLFDSVSSVLRALATKNPVVIALDNLHWADASSLKLLEFVSLELRSSPLLIVGAYRDTNSRTELDLSRTIAGLTRSANFMELQLNPLSDDEIRELIINTCGLDPPDGLVDSVASVSEGSPFFAHNAIQLLGSKGLLTEQSFAQNDDWQVDIPSVVKDVIASRIADLSKPCANMLQQAAVIGREFDFAVLVGLLGEPDVNDLRELLTEAKNAKVINDSGDSSVRFVFDHDLFRQALEVEIHPDVRAGLHLRIAELMDDLFGDSDVEYSGRIAYHYLQAVSVSPIDVVAMACNRAGRVANKAHAYTDGETHFSVAINLLEDSIELRPILAESLEGYARSLAAQGRVSESFDPLRRAFEIYLGEGITERALEISAVSIPHYSRTGATAMLEQAVELSQDDTEAQSLLLSRLGAARAFELQDFDGAEQAHQASLRAARAAKSPFAEAWAYGRAAMVQAPDWEQVESLARKSLEAMPRESNLEIEVHSRIFLAGAFYHQGDITAARTELVRANEIAIQTRNPMRAEQTANELAMLLKLEGRWDECLERQVPVGYQINARPFGPHMVRAQIFYAIGQLDRATAAYSKVRDMMSSSRLSLDLHVPEPGREYGFWQMDIAGLLGITGDTSFLNDVPASELWDELPSDATVLSVSRRPALLLRTWVTGAIAIARDDSATARKVLELVRQYRYPVNNHKTNFGGSHDRLKGRLAATAGLSEEAIGHFEIARQFCSENGLAYDHGWSCHDLALTLVENPKNVARVRSLIKEGQKVADDYGIKPLSDQLAKLETRLSDQASDVPFGLTAREVEILRCLADELTYKQIAERLVVSQNTVGTHVKNIYSKTGSSRRAEALRAAVESGLLSYDE